MAVAVGSRSLHSLSFDGSTGYVVTGPWTVPTGDRTWSCWFCPTNNLNGASPAFSALMGSFASSITRDQLLYQNSGGITGLVYSGANGAVFSNILVYSATFTASVWYHVAITNNNSSWVMYINGVPVVTSTNAFSSFTGNRPVYIGQEGAGSYFNGGIDDVFICSSDIGATAAANIAAGLIDPLSLSPVGYWKMEEGTGTTTADSSGSGNTGTLTGGVTWSNDTPVYLQDYADSGYQTSNSFSFYYRSSGSLRYMVIGISAYANVSFGSPSVTVNGASASLLGFQSGPPAGQGVLLYGLVAPDAPYGSALQVTVTYASGVNNSLAAAISLTGVDQSSSTEAVATANATNVGAADATVATTTSTNGDFLVAVVNTSDGSITAGTGQTETVNNSQTAGTGAMSYKGPISPAGSATMYWTGVGALQTWAIAVVGIKADGATPPVTEQMPWFVTRTIFEEVYEEILNH